MCSWVLLLRPAGLTFHHPLSLNLQRLHPVVVVQGLRPVQVALALQDGAEALDLVEAGVDELQLDRRLLEDIAHATLPLNSGQTSSLYSSPLWPLDTCPIRRAIRAASVRSTKRPALVTNPWSQP